MNVHAVHLKTWVRIASKLCSHRYVLQRLVRTHGYQRLTGNIHINPLALALS